jgi:hypothetical protein
VIHKRTGHTSESATLAGPSTYLPSTFNFFTYSRNGSPKIIVYFHLFKLSKRHPILTMRKAAQIYNISRTTTQDQINGISSRHDISINSQKLTDSEAKVIIKYIIDLDLRAFPPRISDVGDMANLLLAQRVMSDPRVPTHAPTRVGVNWALNFVKR